MFFNFNPFKSILAAMLVLGSLSGEVYGSEKVNFSGFANLGVTYSNSDELAFRNAINNSARDGLSFAPDSVLGLQLNAQLNDKIDAVGQIILQDRADDSVTNYVQMAFLRYQINRNWSVKAGRFSTPSYLYTDYRYVGHAFTWVRPPLEMYSIVGSIGNMDGIQTNYVTDVDFGVVKVGLSYGQTEYQNDFSTGNFRFTYQDLAGINLELQATNWRAQAVMLTAVYDDITFPDIEMTRGAVDLVPDLFKPFAQQAVDFLIPDGTRVTYLSLGGAYNINGLELIAEIGDFQSDWALSSDSTFGYLSAAYSIDYFTPYVTFGIHKRNQDPEIIDFDAAQQALPDLAFQQLAGLLQPADQSVKGTSVDQKSVSLGLRWDFSDSWSFKTQFDHIRMAEFGSGLFAEKPGLVPPAEKLHYNVFNVSFTTIF